MFAKQKITFENFLSGMPARDYIFQDMSYEEQICQAADRIREADYVLLGAGAGMSSAAGAVYGGAWFSENFAEFQQKYGKGPYMQDMYSAGFYPYPDEEAFWGYWSKQIRPSHSRVLSSAPEQSQKNRSSGSYHCRDSRSLQFPSGHRCKVRYPGHGEVSVSESHAGKIHRKNWMYPQKMDYVPHPVGFCEETIFRAIPLNILRNKKIAGERKYMFYCIVISSVLFGLGHVTNMLAGETPCQAIGRAIQAAGAGMIFGAIYWKTGSIMVCAIIHSLWDACGAFCSGLYITNTAETMKNITEMQLLTAGIALLIVNLCIAMFILRKKKENGCQIEAIPMRQQCIPVLA